MSVGADTLLQLADLSLSQEQMAGVLRIIASMSLADEARREKQRIRKQRSRDKNATITGQERDEACDNLSPKKVSPETPSKNNPFPETPNGVSTDSAFEEFWKAYPRREGDNPKKPAKLAYSRALKRGGTPGAILAGAQALARKHPTPTPYVPQTVTWLNQDRWADTESTGPPGEVVQFRRVEDILAEKVGADEARNRTVSGP